METPKKEIQETIRNKFESFEETKRPKEDAKVYGLLRKTYVRINSLVKRIERNEDDIDDLYSKSSKDDFEGNPEQEESQSSDDTIGRIHKIH